MTELSLTRTISSISGTKAIGEHWSLFADSSSRACEVPGGAPPRDRSGASIGVQPRVADAKRTGVQLA